MGTFPHFLLGVARLHEIGDYLFIKGRIIIKIFFYYTSPTKITLKLKKEKEREGMKRKGKKRKKKKKKGKESKEKERKGKKFANLQSPLTSHNDSNRRQTPRSDSSLDY